MLPLSLRNLNHNILPINRFLRRLLGNSKSDDKEFERWIKSITGYKPVNLFYAPEIADINVTAS